ncbi:MAG: hypothetical protein ABR865_15690, partial [Terracidiphilus sp.]
MLYAAHPHNWQNNHMNHLRKQLKWWLRDFWSFVIRKKPAPEPKTVCVYYCRGCGGHHQLRFQRIGLDGIDLSEFRLPGLKIECPKTGEIVYPAQDDLVYLSER